jgi:hypothetical protein
MKLSTILKLDDLLAVCESEAARWPDWRPSASAPFYQIKAEQQNALRVIREGIRRGLYSSVL